MSAADFEMIKDEVLRLVQKHRRPTNPDRIVSAVRHKTDGSDEDVRRAIWHLVARDEIRVTPDWRLFWQSP